MEKYNNYWINTWHVGNKATIEIPVKIIICQLFKFKYGRIIYCKSLSYTLYFFNWKWYEQTKDARLKYESFKADPIRIFWKK